MLDADSESKERHEERREGKERSRGFEGIRIAETDDELHNTRRAAHGRSVETRKHLWIQRHAFPHAW